jgi:hypothetical protein
VNRSFLPVLLLGLCTVFPLAAADSPAAVPADAAPATIAPLPLHGDLSLDEVLEVYGTPDFAVAGVLAYHGSFAGLSADVTLVFRDDGLVEMGFSFQAQGRSAEELRHDADRVLKRLRVLHGPPQTVQRAVGEYKVHAWATPQGALLHTVVYTAGREEHVIRTKADRALAR